MICLSTVLLNFAPVNCYYFCLFVTKGTGNDYLPVKAKKRSCIDGPSLVSHFSGFFFFLHFKFFVPASFPGKSVPLTGQFSFLRLIKKSFRISSNKGSNDRKLHEFPFLLLLRNRVSLYRVGTLTGTCCTEKKR